MNDDADLLIIGGGINGVAIAREAALRGMHAHLIEATDLCYGTSAGSTRLIHGGLRYLEHFEFGLVRESLRERERLLKQRPWRVRNLELQLLVQAGDDHWLSTLRLGLWLYEAMAGRPFGGEVKRIGATAMNSKFPQLRGDGIDGALRYLDAQVRYPERLVVELMTDAVAAGASVDVGNRVESLLRDQGRVVGVECRDGRHLYAPLVINAAGHWVDQLLRRSGTRSQPQLVTTRGSHIMLPRRAGHPDSGLYAQARQDGRAFFLIPWGDCLWVGTTDIYHDDPDTWYATDEEIQYLLDEANTLLPGCDYSHDDIILTRAGIRPLVRKQGRRVSEGAVSRSHKVVDEVDGLLSILGGKLTTHRSLAEEAVNRACQLLGRRSKSPTTRAAPVAEALTDDDRPEALDAEGFARLDRVYGPYARPMLEDIKAQPELAQRLIPELPLLKAEVIHGVTREWAAGLDDLFARRTMLTTEDLPWQGKTRQLAAAVGEMLGWDGDEIELRHSAWLDAITRHDRFTGAMLKR